MERKFRVLKDVYTNISKYTHEPLMKSGEIIDARVLGNGIHIFDDSRFHPTWFEEWLKHGYIEEILPTKSLISLDEKETENMNLTTEDIYDKKHNIYDTMMLLEKMPKVTVIKNEYDDNEWQLSDNGKTLYSDTSINIEDCYDLLEIMYMTFTFVKPQEEKVEKWVEIKDSKQLCNAVIYGKKIKITYTFTNQYMIYENPTNLQIDELFKGLICGHKYKLEYLEA